MKFSLIIPTHNRPKRLKLCIESVFSSKFPKNNFEVVVIIDGYCKESSKLLEHYQKKNNNLKVYNLIPNKGPAAARNYGIKHACGEIIGLTDDDCILENNWIEKMVDVHNQNPDIVVVGGETFPSLSSMKIITGQYLSNLGIQCKISNNIETIYFPTCNVSLKKKIFEKFSFDETIPYAGGEDLEFFWRLFKNNYRFVFDRNIIVHHYRSSLMKVFLKQQYTYGRGNLLVYLYHKDHPVLQKYLSSKYQIIVFRLLECFFNVPAIKMQYQFAQTIMDYYHIKGVKNKIKIFICLILHRICSLLGNMREILKTISNRQYLLSLNQ